MIEFEFRAYDDNRTTGVVDALTEQVLTETTLFTAEHTRERFEISVAGAGNGFASAAVVDESVNGFLKHTLFVAHDDVGRAEFFEFFETVIAVDDSAIQIVEVAGCKSAAVELDHRTQFGRKHGKHVKHHPFGLVARLTERFDDFETLDRFETFLSDGIIDDVFELFAFFFKVDFHKEFLDSLCTHTHFEVFSVVLFEKFSVLFVADDLVFVEFADFARIENDEGHEVNDLFEFLR